MGIFSNPTFSQEEFTREELMAMGEKELLAEIALQLQKINRKCNKIKRRIAIYGD